MWLVGEVGVGTTLGDEVFERVHNEVGVDAQYASPRWELDSPQATDVGINHSQTSATKQPQQIWTANVFSVSRARFSSE